MAAALPAALPPSVTEVTLVSHVVLTLPGMRMRISPVAVICGLVRSSVTVRIAAAAVGSPTVNVWFTAEESESSTMRMVRPSLSMTFPRLSTSSSRLSIVDAAVKLVALKPETVRDDARPKSLVTSTTAVRPASS